MSISLIGLKALLGGLAVVGFSLIGQAGHPKRFAGIFSAAPSVALASLAMTAVSKGAGATVPFAQGMLLGSAGMVAYCLVSLYLIDRLHALLGSILAWLAWFVRFVFGAGIALVAAVAGVLFGPKVGGLFLAFPAVLPATLTLIEKKEGTTKAWADASGGALGAVGLAAFAVTAFLLLRGNPLVALLLALLAWLLVAGGLYFAFRMTGIFLKQDKLLSKSR